MRESYRQQATIAGAERAWYVDTVAAAAAAPWASRAPEALAADLAGMAAYFPHWLLVGTQGGRPARCRPCAAFHVPLDGAIRCPGCGATTDGNGLAWVGHLPALARAEPAFARRRAALHAAGYAEANVGAAEYLLVPLGMLYPAEWPNVEPAVRYAGRWLDALGLPRASAAHHLVGNGQACIFAWGQWSAMPVHAVLQQRMVNHVASLLKITAGQSPTQAFIGRIHHDNWQPERP
ncbi:MAG TPA: hypothetical protein VFX76_02490 [Roseiflexaceae bacterium]|nr:hypothetical protein [Roseiflexaceae bacterium]